MKRVVLIFIAFMLAISSLESQNKSDFEKNGITIRFVTTQLGEIEDNQFKLIKDMNLAGVFIFIPDKKSVVLRHKNGNDELLKVISTKKTHDGNYVFSCNKSRILFISTENKVITYSIEGNSTLFVFPIDEKDIGKLQNIILKY